MTASTVRMPLKQRYLRLISDPAPPVSKRIARRVLGALSLAYQAGVRVRNWAFDSALRATYRPAVPVLSVGNITAGGTGKTPLVAYFANWFLAHGYRVAVLSRGYGRRLASGLNDEGELLRRLAPAAEQLQGKDRCELARRAEQELGADVLILDDGFQHRRLARDLDLVLIDATNPFGYGATLPRGLLREPPSSLKRADAVILTRGDLVSSRQRFALHTRLREVSGGRPVIDAVFEPRSLVDVDGRRRPLNECAHHRVAAFCGIGNSSAFFRSLRTLGLEPVWEVGFPDHHAYTEAECRVLAETARRRGASLLLTTDKDLVKLSADWFDGIPLRAVRIAVRFVSGGRLLHALLRQLLPNRLLRVQPYRHAA